MIIFSLILGSLDNGVSNEVASSGRCSPGDVPSEFGGEAGRSGRMEGSDLDHLCFLKNVNTDM